MALLPLSDRPFLIILPHSRRRRLSSALTIRQRQRRPRFTAHSLPPRHSSVRLAAAESAPAPGSVRTAGAAPATYGLSQLGLHFPVCRPGSAAVVAAGLVRQLVHSLPGLKWSIVVHRPAPNGAILHAGGLVEAGVTPHPLSDFYVAILYCQYRKKHKLPVCTIQFYRSFPCYTIWRISQPLLSP